jgi:hypothetical protein
MKSFLLFIAMFSVSAASVSALPSLSSCTKVRTDQYAPPAGPVGGYPVELQLHGSAGSPPVNKYIYGEEWTCTGDKTMGWWDGLPIQFWLRNLSGKYAAPSLGIQPNDIVSRNGSGFMNITQYPNMESWWFGYTTEETPKVAHPYTERWLDALYTWFFNNYPQASTTKVTASGQSMGGWGLFHYAMRRPQMFAAIFARMPRWQWTYLPDLKTGYGILQPDTIMETGEPFAQAMDATAYVADTANRIPFLSWCIGRNDGYRPFQDHVDAVAALRAAKRGFVFSWNNGNHGGGPAAETVILATYKRSMFELGKGYPILLNSSRDDDPADPTVLVGGINLGFKWRNVVESATGWSAGISNVLGETTVDVLPHSDIFKEVVSQQTVIIPAGTWVTVSFTAP